MTSQSVGKFYENVNFLDQFCTQKLERRMESDEKIVGGESFELSNNAVQKSIIFFVIEIIALKDKLLFNKNIKISNL